MAIQRDTVLMTRIELTGEQHQLQMVDELWESILQIMALCVAENSADVSSVGQKMQSFPLLYQTGAKLRRDVAFQSPGGNMMG
ncbi:hypothetical protein BGV46_15925 [Serratia marcescens]|nr:hypothetical protein RN42_02040 [Serratia marcescens]OHT33299.1 hypothetical protein BGV45_14935 [Serratia marcescens]OHT33861.1 hypothetical protein BGV46_15925 [Serratia marcescens]